MVEKYLALTIPGPNGKPMTITAPSGIPTGGLSGDGGNILGFGISIFLTVCALLALGFLVYGGISWMTSQGDKTKIESSRKTITYAIIGILIAFLAIFIVNFFLKAFSSDLDLFNLSL